MADTVVNYLLNNLSQLLQQEATLLSGVEDKVKLLQQELERINAFLKDSEGKRDEHETVKVVVSQIRDVAYEAQDVIDNYIVNVIKQQRRSLVGKAIHSFDHARMLHDVNNKIEMIKTTIKDIYDNKDKYGIKEGESRKADSEVAAELVQMRRSNVEEDEVVGFDEYSNEVIKLLVEGNPSLDIVSIVGMAGLGKTTLARKVYKDPLLNKQFDCCAWEFVSQEYNAKELLLSLMRNFMSIPEDVLRQNKKNNNEKESDSSTSRAQELVMLKRMLRDHLTDMRYLIVLDDMWSSQVWNEVRDAFPNDNMGSRILITSRSEEVALQISRSDPYRLKRLSDDDSWVLFSKKVFRGEECPSNLETLGRNIAKGCKGLPLSIIVIAGILRNKEKSERVWEKVVGNVNWYLNQEDTLVKQIVRLSYDSLPRRLKPCFLYLGIYPEDFEIPVRQLIQLWVAEGFIQETGTRIPEDVAEDYLEELIRRSLVQVASRRTDGGVKTCRIHDLLRELCISEGIEDKIFEVRTDVSILKEGKPRRLSIHCSTPYYMSESPCDHSCTRSLFCFGKDKYTCNYKFGNWLVKGLKLVRVLDFGQVKDSYLMLDKLEKLIHLRYLRTHTNDSFSLPNSIYNLWNLETLDLRGSRIIGLPDGIWKLKRLRHLYMSAGGSLPDIPGRKVLAKLQTLTTIRFDQKSVHQLEKGKFPNLRKLGIDCFNSYEPNPIELLRRLERLRHLNSLKIIYGKDDPTSVKGYPPNITKITLVGGLHLSKIVNALGSLPKLRYLKITGQYSDRLTSFKLECTDAGCFQQLQVLKMKGLKCESWKLAQGAMPQLRSLVINRCEFLTSLPIAQSLTTLRELEVLWSSKEVVDKLQSLVLKDVCKLTVYPAPGEEEEYPNYD